MKGRDRRSFLKLCAATASALAIEGGRGAGQQVGAVGGAGAVAGAKSAKPAAGNGGFKASTLEKYVDPLPLPKRLMPVGMRGETTLYEVRMMEFERKMHKQLPATRLWGYEGQYPGPYFDAMRGKPVEVLWKNELPLKHLLPVDTKLHGAMAPAPAVRTVPHLHGSRTTAESDGMPEEWFVRGESGRYGYPNEQRAATLWYHDHAMGITRLNMYAGMVGFYLLRDEQELAMNLPSGAYEIPLVLQDRTLDEHGQLVYAPTMEDGLELPPGTWGPECFGDLPVVNGTIYPYHDVEPRRYRLRVVNGANSRFFNLYLNLAAHPTDVPTLVPFEQIGSDGGLLARPVTLSKLLLAPGERADLVVDFTRYAGKTATLSNSASVPYPGWDMMQAMHAPLNELMQFRVKLPVRPGPASGLPTAIELPRLAAADAVVTRDFVLDERLDADGKSLGVRINDKNYDEPVTEFPKLGTMERWRFINLTDDAHPMHLHLVQFQVLERQGFNLPTFQQTGKLAFEGGPRPPAANESGWKDTAVVTPREVLTLLVPFEGYAGRYVYHCHMLEHEDNDMMRPFVVVDPKA